MQVENRQSDLLMPIKSTPYQHQREAFAFACALFGLRDAPAREVIKENGGDETCQKKKPNPEA